MKLILRLLCLLVFGDYFWCFEDFAGAVPVSKSHDGELDLDGSQVIVRTANFDSFLWSHSKGVSVSLLTLV